MKKFLKVTLYVLIGVIGIAMLIPPMKVQKSV